MTAKILTARRGDAGSPPSPIQGDPANQTTADPTVSLDVMGTVTSEEPIEWVFSQDSGGSWIVFDPATEQVRDLMFNQTFFDDFATGGVPDPAYWTRYDSPGHAGNGVRDPNQIWLSGGNCIIAGENDPVNGVKSGGMNHSWTQLFGRWRVYARVDTDSSFTFAGLALLWAPENNGTGWVGPGGEIDFWENTSGNADDRNPIEIFVHGNNGGVPPDIQTYIAYPGGLNGSDWREYVMEWFPGRLDFYYDSYQDRGGGVYVGTVIDSTSTPIPKYALFLALQLDAFKTSYSGPQIQAQYGYAAISQLVTVPIQVRARLVSDPDTYSSTATVVVTGVTDTVVSFTTDLPASTVRNLGDNLNLVAAWSPAADFQVEEQAPGGSWVNAGGIGSSGVGATGTTFQPSTPVIAQQDGYKYRIRVTLGGDVTFSTTTTLTVDTGTCVVEIAERPDWISLVPGAGGAYRNMWNVADFDYWKVNAVPGDVLVFKASLTVPAGGLEWRGSRRGGTAASGVAGNHIAISADPGVDLTGASVTDGTPVIAFLGVDHIDLHALNVTAGDRGILLQDFRGTSGSRCQIRRNVIWNMGGPGIVIQDYTPYTSGAHSRYVDCIANTVHTTHASSDNWEARGIHIGSRRNRWEDRTQHIRCWGNEMYGIVADSFMVYPGVTNFEIKDNYIHDITLAAGGPIACISVLYADLAGGSGEGDLVPPGDITDAVGLIEGNRIHAYTGPTSFQTPIQVGFGGVEMRSNLIWDYTSDMVRPAIRLVSEQSFGNTALEIHNNTFDNDGYVDDGSNPAPARIINASGNIYDGGETGDYTHNGTTSDFVGPITGTAVHTNYSADWQGYGTGFFLQSGSGANNVGSNTEALTEHCASVLPHYGAMPELP